MREIYDPNVKGTIYYEPDFPKIRYFKMFGTYYLGKYKTFIIGGAYSVDKFYRLDRGFNWFPSEQLTEQERANAEFEFKYEKFDLVLSHTCPLAWMPTDLFLKGLDQSTVDKTMEIWLNRLKEKDNFTVWLFGHYHGDQLVRPGVEMYFNDMEMLDTIMKRWTDGNIEEFPWWLQKSPNYYMGR